MTTELQVFLASPSDIPAIRESFPIILDRVSTTIGNEKTPVLRPVMWERVTPGVGRTQELINKQLSTCALLLIVFSERWGSPTGEFTSGTEEEFYEAIGLRKRTGSPEIFVYFKRRLRRSDSPDVVRILKFKNWIETNFVLFSYSYSSENDLQKSIEQHISSWFRERLSKTRRATQMLTTGEGEHGLLEAAWRQANKALDLSERGLHKDGEEIFGSALETFEHPGILNQFAAVLIRTGEFNRAQMILKRAVLLSQEGTSDWVNAQCNLAKIELLRGDPFRSKKRLSKCLKVAWQIGRPGTVGRIYQSFTELYLLQGNGPAAAESAEKAAKAYLLAGNLLELVWALHDLGVLLLEDSQPELAADYLEAALEYATKAKSDETLAKILINIGRLHAALGESNRAEKNLDQAIAICRRHHLRRELAGALSQLGHLRIQQDRVGEAAKLFTDALALEEELNNKAGMADDHGVLAVIYGAANELGRAEEHAARAVEIFAMMGHKEKLKSARKVLRGIRSLRKKH